MILNYQVLIEKITKNKTYHLLVKNELTTLKSKIPDISNLVKKTDYNTKVSTLDGKITSKRCCITFFWEIQCLMEKMVFKPI